MHTMGGTMQKINDISPNRKLPFRFPQIGRYFRRIVLSTFLVRFAKLIFLCVPFLILILCIVDFLDFVNYAQYFRSKFIEANSIVTTISALHSQSSLLRAVTSSFLITAQYKQTMKLRTSMNDFMTDLGIHKKTASDNGVVVAYFMIANGLLCFGRFLTILFLVLGSEPVINSPYSVFPSDLSELIVISYLAGVVFLSAMLDIFVEGTFVFFCSCLNSCAAALHTGIQNQITSLSLDKVKHALFIAGLRDIRTKYELLIELSNQLQNALGWQILVSLAGNIMEVFAVTAWFVIWAFQSTAQSDASDSRQLMRCGLTILISVCNLGFLCSEPIRLQNKENRIVEANEQLLILRQLIRSTVLTTEELDLLISLGDRGESKRLTIAAGGIVEITPSFILTLVCCYMGFVVFAIQRMENRHAELTFTPLRMLESNISSSTDSAQMFSF